MLHHKLHKKSVMGWKKVATHENAFDVMKSIKKDEEDGLQYRAEKLLEDLV
jgi:hypothetical protein